MNKSYTRIDWENEPSDKTPINETNLNKMDAALDELDNRLIAQDAEKVTKTEVETMVADVSFEESTGIITVTRKNGSSFTIDTKLEKIAVNFTYDSTTQQIILTLIDGTKQYIDLSALITQYEFLDSDTITFVVQSDGKIKAEVLDGSITESKLQPNYLAEIKVQAANALSSANNAETSAKQSQSYAVGGTGTRENEDIDNAQYYYQQAKAISESFSGALRPIGTVTFANLPSLSSATEGDMYNVSDQFVTTSDFKEGSGLIIPAGSNIYKTVDGYWDILAGIPVDTSIFALKEKYGDTTINVGRKANTTVGNYSVAEGFKTIASGNASHAGGECTEVYCGCAMAIGAYNNDNSDGSLDFQIYDSSFAGIDETYNAFMIGNGYGTSISSRNNAFRVAYNGNVYAQAAYNSSGADYAEFICEWADKNTNNEDRVGYFVTIKNNKLYKANDGDYIAGITSGNPSVVGNSDETYFWKYERDEFNRFVYVEKPVQDENGNEVMDEDGNILTHTVRKLSDDYDPSQKYISRKNRPEWDYVGMIGVIPVHDDGTCIVNGYCKCGTDGVATVAEDKDEFTYFVKERISDEVITVII